MATAKTQDKPYKPAKVDKYPYLTYSKDPKATVKKG